MSVTTRRRFVTAAATGVTGVAAVARAADPGAANSGLCTEDAREVPLTADADVIVCGAGPAGVTAAITAARAGAKVRLFEAHGALGGVWTNSHAPV
jgi:NADPH-dependent glutamate synthase beta subunit-like oxidoreductase